MRRAALFALAAILPAACSGASGPERLQGYVEGEFVRIGPEAAGRLTALAVSRGEAVAAGAPLFALDERDERAALARANAEKAAAEATLADLRVGRRPEEIRVLDAAIAEAEAALTAAQKTYDRNQQLRGAAVASAAALDQATADLDAARARLEAARQNRAVAELPARLDAIRAAGENVAALSAAVSAAEIRLARRRIAAPAAGRIDDTFFRVGELVPAGQPVVSLLPPEGRKIVFFLPEPQRARLAPGTAVAIRCDGCGDRLSAVISSIAASAEFSPPVIYSTESRAKLVFRVEARPEGDAIRLDPGQPIEIVLPGGSRP